VFLEITRHSTISQKRTNKRDSQVPMGAEPRTGAEYQWEPRTNGSRAEDGSRGQMGAEPRTGAEDKWEATPKNETEERGDR
jgi:hypothetical protein